ncbi:hypothetical protein [Chachezhania antarctica]|uniref:hypothetical protein n=1 Tax=Chachezhania antarctica TaxID=2340860 RepID=UPI0013CF39C8|nr:hypothetical protein [Chachezhania antarctica]|tara:strand:+ start:2376 stop:2669 length:294 start_codon:yes stop_codon:yes gene_type:complete
MPLSAGTRKNDCPSDLRRQVRDPGRTGIEARRCLALHALGKPRTQAELRDILEMSNSGVLHLLRRLERDGYARPVERIGRTMVWEKVSRDGKGPAVK